MNMRIALFAAAVIALASSSCALFEREEEFVIQADSVTGSSSVLFGTAFELIVHARVGADACSQFKEFRGPRTSTGADISIIGKKTLGGECAMMPTEMHASFIVFPYVADPYVLRIHQRDGTILSKTVRIR
jgi:hypothetical protein